MVGAVSRWLCRCGLHRWRGYSPIPHTYQCTRPGCTAFTAGHA